MTKNDDGSFEITFSGVNPKEDGTPYQFKVTTNDTWEPAYGYAGLIAAGGANVQIAVTEANSTVKVVLTSELKVKIYVNGVDKTPTDLPTEETKATQTTNDKGETSAVTSGGGIYTGPTTGAPSKRFFFAMPAEWYTFNNAKACVYWWDGTDKCADWQHSYQMRSTAIETTDGSRVYYADIAEDVPTVVFNNGIDGGVKAAEGEQPSVNWGKNYQTKNVKLQGYMEGESDVYPSGVDSFENMVCIVNPNDVEINELSGSVTYGGEWYYLHADGTWNTTKGSIYKVKDVNVVLDREAVTAVGKTITLITKYENLETGAEKIWSSSNTSVATVDQNGKVTGKGKGTAVISLSVKNPGDAEALVVSCTVTVKQLATTIRLNATSTTIYTGNTYTIRPSVLPMTTNNKGVKYKSSNTKVATVNSKGVVKGISPGEAYITVQTIDGSNKSAKCNIIVMPSTKENYIKSANSFNKYYGDKQFNLGAKAKTKLSYKTSNKNVATVDSKGRITIKGIGKATITITAKATSSYKSATKKVTISVTLKSLSKNTIKTNTVNKSTVKVSWPRVSGVGGYHIKISTRVSGLNINNDKRITKNTVTLKNAKKGQKIKFSIRTYRKIGNKTYYSTWVAKNIVV